MHPDLQTQARQILAAAALPEPGSLHTAFIAMSKARYSLSESAEAFQNIFEGQWANGMLPHCISSTREQLPADTGQTKIAEGVYTSSICMPPVLGFLLWRIYQQPEDKKAVLPLLENYYPKIYRFHQYLYEARDPLEEGLVYIRHPQESIAATSPDWRIGEVGTAPSGTNEAELFESSGFAVQSPLFNALLCWSNECLIEMALILGEEVTELIRWQELSLHSLNEKCWSEASGCYTAYNLKSSERILMHGLAGLLPLCGGLPTQEQAEDILGWLASPAFGAGREDVLLCPTHAIQSPDFQASQPWAGAISMLGNWLLYMGLMRYDMEDAAAKVRRQSLNLIDGYGFRDHFPAQGKRGEDTMTKSGLSAALYLDLLRT